MGRLKHKNGIAGYAATVGGSMGDIMSEKRKRGAAGAGSIRHRKDGRWEARFSVGFDPGTGKQIQKSVYGSTQAEVRKKLQTATAKVDSGLYIDPSRLSLREWVQTWLDTYCQHLKPNTKNEYENRAKLYIFPRLGAVKLSKLQAPQIQRLYNSLLEQESPLSPATIRLVHVVIDRAIKKAVDLRYIPDNPADKVTLPRLSHPEIKPMPDNEIRLYLAALEDDRYRDFLQFLLFTGARVSEALGLAWDCIDFDRGTIEIKRQYYRSGGAPVLAVPKNGKPRTITPAPYVISLLRQRKAKQAADRLRAGEVWQPSPLADFVFTDEIGRPFNRQGADRHHKKALAAAGLSAYRLHDLRHTYAVAALRAGDDIKTVSENLGHASVAFTLDVYMHVTGDMKQASAARMDRFIKELMQ